MKKTTPHRAHKSFFPLISQTLVRRGPQLTLSDTLPVGKANFTDPDRSGILLLTLL